MSKFKIPTDDALLEAIGLAVKTHHEGERGKYDGFLLKYEEMYPNTGKNLPPDFVKYFIPDSESFTKISKPGPDDWLASHKESPQTFAKFVTAWTTKPDGTRNTVYLQPMSFFEDPVPQFTLEPLTVYAEIFFGIPVVLLENVKLKGAVHDRKLEHTGIRQVNATDLLAVLKGQLKPNAFCLAGITMCDLYPKPDSNFVFGLASFPNRVGVYSLARYMTHFSRHRSSIFDEHADSVPNILRRACKTMCHEISHMFGLSHCVHFQCLMNGSNNLEEADARPSFLCPCCLRKLQFSCSFDVTERYTKMLAFWSEQHLEEEVSWLTKRIEWLTTT